MRATDRASCRPPRRRGNATLTEPGALHALAVETRGKAIFQVDVRRPGAKA